jgi:hypothetical protein
LIFTFTKYEHDTSCLFALTKYPTPTGKPFFAMNIDNRQFSMKNELLHSLRDKRYGSSGCRQSRNDDDVSSEPWDDCHVTTRKAIVVSKSSLLTRDVMSLTVSSMADQGMSLDELITLCAPRRRRHDHERFAPDLMSSTSNWACMPRRSDAKKRRLEESGTGNI